MDTKNRSSQNIRLFDPETLIDPYPEYKRLRDETPIVYEPSMDMHVITRYDLLREAIGDSETYSSKFDDFMTRVHLTLFASFPEDRKAELISIQEEMVPIPPTLLTLDKPEHAQYRSLVSKLFTVPQINKSRASVQAVIDETIDTFSNHTEIEFMKQFAFPVPLRVIADRLGIPTQNREFFDEAATAAAASLRLSPISPDVLLRRTQLALDLQKLLISLLEARRKEPEDDMITILAASKLEKEDRHLTHGEALGILGQFLVAGHETTTSSFGWGMLLLCRNPALQDEIRGDEKLIKTFVEEALRMEAPVQGLPRVVTKDTQLGGYDLKEGDLVMLRFGAANRDERQFENPDVIQVQRKKAGMQMAFGSGAHHCIGSPLARQELNLGWYALLENMSNIRLDDAYPEPQAEPSVILRNLPELNIKFDRG